MTPYGYHNSEMTHSRGDERKLAREAIREAKLARRLADAEAAGGEFEVSATRPGFWHRVLASAPHLAPRT